MIYNQFESEHVNPASLTLSLREPTLLYRRQILTSQVDPRTERVKYL